MFSSIQPAECFESYFLPFRVLLSFINVPGGFSRLYRIIAKDFGNLGPF